MKRAKSTRSNKNARREPGACDTRFADYAPDYDSVKNLLQSGRDLRVIDYPPESRPQLLGTLAKLCDELPDFTTWQTLRESRVCETRLRVRRYWLPKQFIMGVVHD